MSQQPNKRKTRVIVAFFVHSRGFSIAVFEDALTVLNAYNVVIHKYPIKNKVLLKKIKEKIDFYLPEIVILENSKGYGSRKSKRVQKVIKLIENHALLNNLNVHKYSRNDIRFVFNSFHAHSKYEIAKVISENLKQLPVELPQRRLSHQPEHYSMAIFDAISLGITHYYKN
ncbi:conserved protein of unknown function [Tenacibaculum sp. 190524A02b]|uniref:hypothetical protein n=1 Tax=Tenacibaculum vairaonense TaxID=3137860 RepID=UPI0032B152E5